jgi:ATP synthase protein I
MQRKSSSKTPLHKIAELSSIGLRLPSSIAIGLFMGYYLDKLFGTQPWLLLIFLLLGIASGMISLLKGIKKYQ